MNTQVSEALVQYLAELVRCYPAAAEHHRVEPWLGHDHTYLISILPPQDEESWIDLNETMAGIATDLVVETGCLFVLTTLE